MKKIFVTVSIALFSFVAMQAQLFVGGGIGFSSSGGFDKAGSTSTDKTKNSSFSFAPKAGYIVSEDLYVGLQLMISSTKSTYSNDDYDKSSSFGFAPFARYYAVRFDKLSLFAQGEISLAFGSSKSKVGTTTTDGPKSTDFGISFYPGIAYNLSDKIELEAYIGGFNLGYASSTEKQTIAGTDYIDKTTNFGFGVTTDNIITTGSVHIGFIFKL